MFYKIAVWELKRTVQVKGRLTTLLQTATQKTDSLI